MSLRINHNVLSMRAHRNVFNTSKSMDQAVTRLSSGLRINSADDDPAGIAISERFRSHIASMEMAERNASYAINMFATAEGALGSIDDKLIRMRALAIEAGAEDVTSDENGHEIFCAADDLSAVADALASRMEDTAARSTLPDDIDPAAVDALALPLMLS